MTSIETFSIVIAAIGVLIAAVNQIYTSRQANQQRAIELKNQELSLHAQQQALETRQAELFINIYNRWTDPEFAKHYHAVRWDIGEKWKTLSADEQEQLIKEMDAKGDFSGHLLLEFYEGIGVLVQEGLIDVNLVKNLLSHRVIWYWETFKDVFIRERELFQDPTHHDSVEYLYNVMKQRQQVAVNT